MAREKIPDVKNTQETYGRFFEYTREGIIISGKEGRILDANPAAARILGYRSPEELIGMESSILYKDPVDREKIFRKLKKNGYVENYPLTFRKKKGGHVHLLGSAVVSKNIQGKITMVEGIFIDVTQLRHTEKKLKTLQLQLEEKVQKRTAQLQKRNEQLMSEIRKRRQIEKKLKASETNFRNLIQTAPDGIYVLDLEGRIISRNEAAKKLGGYEDKEVIGKKFYQTPSFLQKNIKKYQKILKDFQMGNVRSPVEFDFLTVSQEKRTAEAHFSLIKEKGKPLGILAVLRDITEKKRTEKSLRQSQAQLKEQNRLLEEKNIALREVMDQIKEEKERLSQQVLHNLDKLVFPVIERLKLRCKNDSDKQFVSLLEDNLRNLASPFGQEISQDINTLTPKEIEICNMIASGMSSKEIGRLLDISFRTVETHRNNIRKKLGIQNERINLSSYLKSMKLGSPLNA